MTPAERAPSHSAAFPLRGLKGLWWEPRQYLPWPPVLEAADYNFFLLCYTFCAETSLRWRHPLDRAAQDVIARLAGDCGRRGIVLGLAIHPLIGFHSWAPRQAAVRFHPTVGADWFHRYWQARQGGGTVAPDAPLRYDSARDLDVLIDRYRQAYRCGVRAFALCLDDIDLSASGLGPADLAEAQCRVVGELWTRLRAIDPRVRLLVVPTLYWTGGLRAHPLYTRRLAGGFPPGVDVFWTGDEVRSQAITRTQATEATVLFGRHPVVWFNYASNDSFRFSLQLPPAPPPAADLSLAVAGLVVNPMRQVALSRLHVLVMGEYLRDPQDYAHTGALKRACVGLLGATDAPLLERVVSAWSAYPDPRTLGDDLADASPEWRSALVARLAACQAELDEVLPRLRAHVLVYAELIAARDRLGLLLSALQVRDQELDGVDASTARDRLLARLSEVDDEMAADARLQLH
jgi:hypothetical protein